VFAKTQDADNKALQAVFQKFVDVSLTLNKSKCEFNKHSLTFFRFVFFAKRTSLDPKKVQAIHNASPPQPPPVVSEAIYCAKFIPKFSDVSQPLCELTRTLHFSGKRSTRCLSKVSSNC